MKINQRIIQGLALATLAFNLQPSTGFAQGGVWTYKAPIPIARQYASVVQLNGQIYAIGGYCSTNDPVKLNSVEVYDPVSNSWTPKAPKPHPGHGFSAGVINGLIYVAGSPDQQNGSLDVYDPTNDSWTSKTPPPMPCFAAGHAVVGGKLYLIGGDAYGWQRNYTQVYDPVTDSWQIGVSAPNLGPTACCVYNGQIYAVNWSYNNQRGTGMVSVYDPATDAWTGKTPMPTVTQVSCLEVVNGLMYAVGGWSQDFGVTNLVGVYNPDADTWTNGPALLEPVNAMGTCVLNGVLYAVGGQNGTTEISSVEALIPYSVSINMYAGLTICGQIGSTNIIEYKNELTDANWTPLTTLILSNNPCLYIDTNSTWFSHRFYQAVPAQ
jgi:N-acetylneuraminic acid mutarotase